MANDDSNWLRNLFVVPIIVGIIIPALRGVLHLTDKSVEDEEHFR